MNGALDLFGLGFGYWLLRLRWCGIPTAFAATLEHVVQNVGAIIGAITGCHHYPRFVVAGHETPRLRPRRMAKHRFSVPVETKHRRRPVTTHCY